MGFSLGEVAQLITALGALGAFVSSRINKQAIKEVHLTLNSRLDELLKSARAASRAEGVVQGHEEANAKKKESDEPL